MSITSDLRHWRFWRRFAVHGFAAFGVIATIAEVAQQLFPGVLTGRGDLLTLGIVVSSGFGVIAAWPQTIQASFDSPTTQVRIVRGDLFDQSSHLVIGASDTFDIAPPYITQGSVQGQFATRVFGGDLDALDRELETALRHAPIVGTVAKQGKTERRAIGTVATLHQQARRFFLLAYTSMDEHNKAHGTVDGLWASLSSLWSEVRRESNGTAVAMPVIGGGQSGLSPVLPAEDAIRLTVLSFIIASRRDKVCDELVLVARPEQFDRFDHLELRAFLRALRRS